MNKLIGILIILPALLLYSGCADKSPLTGPAETITVGCGKTAILVYVAKEQKFFESKGLDVEIKDYDAGKLATDALIAGKIDISTASASVFVSHSFTDKDLRTLGSIATHHLNEFIARKDHGIEHFSDVKGKKIGVTRKSTGEFLLGRLLSFNQLSLQDIDIIDLPPPAIVEALINSEIDAALTWGQNIFQIKKRLGPKAVSWPAQGDQDIYFILISKDKWIMSHSSAAERFLKALVEAEEYVKTNPVKTQNFVQQKFNYEASYLQAVWPKHNFNIRLPQAMIIAMEDQARWRIDNKLTDKTKVPNYLDYIYFDGIMAAKPQAITIIR